MFLNLLLHLYVKRSKLNELFYFLRIYFTPYLPFSSQNLENMSYFKFISLFQGSNAKFLCQLPFSQYEKQQKLFARVLEKPFSKKVSVLQKVKY